MKGIPSLNFLAGWLAFSAAGHAACTSPEKPSITFILADDCGVREVRCYGADNYKTPNIDAWPAKVFGTPTPARCPSAVRRAPSL